MDSMKFIFQTTAHTNPIFTFILDQIMIHVSIMPARLSGNHTVLVLVSG